MPPGAIKGRVVLTATLVCKTGLHIGAGGEAQEIGGLDMPVVRDPLTREPYVPGSSQRGKLRSLMERRQLTRLAEAGEPVGNFFNKNLASRGNPDVRHHECERSDCIPCRVFGTSRDLTAGVQNNRPGRLLVRDAPLLSDSRDLLADMPTGQYTEIKYENTLDRITSAAQPRQVERVPRGAQFAIEMVYTVEDEQQAREDLQELLICLRLLQDDYLGGGGARGYGQVEFKDLKLRWRPNGYYEGTAEEKTVPVDLEEARPAWDQLLDQLFGGDPEG